MNVRRGTAAVLAFAMLATCVMTGPAFADPVEVVGSGDGVVTGGITLPGGGSGGGPGPTGPVTVGSGGGGPGTVVAGGGGGGEAPGLGDFLAGIGGTLSCTVGETVATNPLCPADPAEPAAPPPPNPAVLAQQLREQMRQQLPMPSLTVSPDLPNTYNPDIGYPITMVNLWFWFWASPEVWQPASQTLSVGGITVTTTATPVTLSYDPGNGDSAAQCNQAGRPWTPADDVAAPQDVGACGYLYQSVTPTPIVGTLSITWLVTWTVNGSPAGTLAPMTTTTDTPEFVVAQVRVMHR